MIAALQFLRAPGSSPLLTLLTGIPLGALLYAIISMLLRSHEVRDTLAVIRKLRRS
jgi:hypothetical protein